MTLLDYELHLRTDRVLKGLDIFHKGQIIDLHKKNSKWAATAKIGMYKMRIQVNDINIITCSCQCDRRFTKFCEHSIGMLYALREVLGLKPILASFVPELIPDDKSLDLLVRSFKRIEKLTDETVNSFTRAVNETLKQMETDFKKKEYESAAGKAIQVCAAVQRMDKLMEYQYAESKACTAPALELLESLFAIPVEEELQAMIFHDVRIEAVRNFQHVVRRRTNWFDIFLAGANTPARKDKFIRTMNALRVLVEASETPYPAALYIEHLEDYRDKIR